MRAPARAARLSRPTVGAPSSPGRRSPRPLTSVSSTSARALSASKHSRLSVSKPRCANPMPPHAITTRRRSLDTAQVNQASPRIAPAMARLTDPYFRWATGARIMRPWWRHRFHAFGAESLLHRPDWLSGPDRIAIGDRVWIAPHAWFEASATARDRDGPLIRIGDGVVLRHHVTISAADSVVIEDDVLIAAWTSIYD